MIEVPWWDQWPEVLERETTALDAAGIRWERDEIAFSQGVLRLKLIVPSADGSLNLLVVYPDCYPYFRFQVYAPGLDLPYHQNPFERNLCLIGRRTHYWDTTDTAADLLNRQLPKLMASASSNDAAAVDGLEERQAEPFSDYYKYQPSMILVQSDWSVSPAHRRGYLVVGTLPNGEQLPDTLIRGAVLELRSEAGEVLCSATPSLRTAFSGKAIEGRWARLNEPIRHSHEGKFIEELLRIHPQLKDAKPNHVNDGWLRIWGVLFPEQTAHRVVGEGWVFACAVDKNRPNTASVSRPHFQHSGKNKKGKKGHGRR